MAITPLQSRIEEILSGSKTITPQSRIEVLLIELIEAIEESGEASAYHYKGSVNSVNDLPENAEVGDVYNVIATGMNYAWTGTEWDALGWLVEVISNILENSQSPVTSAAIYSALAGKVNTEQGKGLSTNDFTNTDKANLATALEKANAAAPQATTYTDAEVGALLAGKVDKVDGKGLSTEDFTAAEKSKLAGIAAGAEVNVQANWAQTNSSADDFIKNKPALGAAASKGVDSAPTASSTNLVTSGGVATALAAKLNKSDVDAALSSTSTNPVQNKAVQAPIARLVDAGKKNLLKFTATSRTINGVTFTVNADQTVTVNGTNTGTGAASFILVPYRQANLIPDGNYWISGCPQGGSSNTFDFRWYHYSPNVSAYDRGSGATIRKRGNTTESNIAIVVMVGVTVNNITFKPMLCTAEDYAISQEFVPYAPSNRELYENKANFLSKSLVATGNLDDISTDEFAIYTTEVTGKPQSGYAFVRTSIFDSDAALQELTMLSGNSSGHAYVRVKYSRKWTEWRETTT